MASPEPIPGKCGAKVFVRVDNKPTDELAGYCARWPMKGGRRCPMHGGRAKQVKAKAAVREVERKAEAALVKRMPTAEPIRGAQAVEAVERIIGLTVQKAEWFNTEMDRLIEAGDLTVTTVSQGEQLKAVMLAGERWLKEARAAAADYVRLGMDERRLQIDKAQAQITFDHIVRVLDAAMVAAGLSSEQQVRLRAEIGKAL